MKRYLHSDVLAILGLVGLWLLFFWRLFTPVAADQASLAQGDFSGQFVAFGAYQYARLSEGEIPLWNPYNNSGLPFIADTQAAVFYPPRLLTIAAARLAGGWSYHALELEMTFHVLAYSLLMYAFARRLTLRQPGSVFAGFIAAVIAGYSGFTTGYPLLQLALLEAAIWLPLGALGVLEATREQRVRWPWLLVTGLALGLSWLAGHPQTSYFMTLLLVAYTAYRCFSAGVGWRSFVLMVAIFGAVAFALSAVLLLPGLEYLTRTARAGMSYDAKGNGFPFQDIVQFIFPEIVSVFSPLYAGIVGLVLALIAVVKRQPQTAFWATVALVALLWSLGANSPIYPLFYNLLPGSAYFRGQERAAVLVMNSLAVLAALGAVVLANWQSRPASAGARLRSILRLLFAICLIFAAFVVAAWLGARQQYDDIVGPVVRSTAVAAAVVAVISYLTSARARAQARWLLAAVLVFELFAVGMDAEAVYDPVPPETQLSMTPPPLVAAVLEDSDGVFRVDGFRGLTDNFGSLYGVLDMRGISPLFLDGPYRLIESEKINPRAWELFAVRYVFSDWQELPIPSTIVERGEDRYGPVNLHRLEDPRPFAALLYEASLVDDREAALALAADPGINVRAVAVLESAPPVALPGEAPEETQATVTAFKPERIEIAVRTPEPAILSLAHPYYPGWAATLNGEPVEIMRAYGALSAIAVPAGEHRIALVYDPFSFRAGALVSAAGWAACVIMLLAFAVQGRFGRRA
ncbi:MAG: YfhO family protein [Chloroflexota bacterium]